MASVKSKKAATTKKAAKKSASAKAMKPKVKASKKKLVKKASAPKKQIKKAAGKKAPAVKKSKVSAKKAAPKKAVKSSKAPKAVKGVSKQATKSKKALPVKVKSASVKVKSLPAKASTPLKVAVSVKGKEKGKEKSKDKIKDKVKPVKAAASLQKTPSSAEKKKENQAKPTDVNSRKKQSSEAIEPLQAKAEKAIKELEERMDLSKMRPRIQAGTGHLKPLHKPVLPLPKLPEPTNTTKEKFQLEFEFRSSPKILFTSLSDSSGLAGWFADEVHTKDDVYTFVWEGGESLAKLIALRDLQLVRFQWLDDTDGTYFQFEIKEDDITSDIALVITDFANPGERETNIRLWESQVQKLRMLLGSL